MEQGIDYVSTVASFDARWNGPAFGQGVEASCQRFAIWRRVLEGRPQVQDSDGGAEIAGERCSPAESCQSGADAGVEHRDRQRRGGRLHRGAERGLGLNHDDLRLADNS